MKVSTGGYFFFNQKSWFLNESTDLLVESIISYTFYKTYYPESTLILSKQQIDPPFARTWWNRNSVSRKSQHENCILAGLKKLFSCINQTRLETPSWPQTWSRLQAFGEELLHEEEDSLDTSTPIHPPQCLFSVANSNNLENSGGRNTLP